MKYRLANRNRGSSPRIERKGPRGRSDPTRDMTRISLVDRILSGRVGAGRVRRFPKSRGSGRVTFRHLDKIAGQVGWADPTRPNLAPEISPASRTATMTLDAKLTVPVWCKVAAAVADTAVDCSSRTAGHRNTTAVRCCGGVLDVDSRTMTRYVVEMGYICTLTKKRHMTFKYFWLST